MTPTRCNRGSAVLQVALLAGLTLAAVPASLGQNTTQQNLSQAELDYDAAVRIRSRPDATPQQLREAARLLRASSGVRIAAALTPWQDDGGDGSAGPAARLHRGQARIVEFADEAASFNAAIGELGKAFLRGEGVPKDLEVAMALLQRAAEGGHPEAQAEAGFSAALGLRPVSETGFAFREPDLPAALLHYYFAAAGNSSVAQMALGYRHVHGLGVPKSCQTAVLYYNPVAEQVVQLARYPQSLPQIERVRLSARALEGPRPAREQDVLHYQWFADLGNVDAQRAVGQILSGGGAQRDPEQALRYFLRAADGGDPDAMASLGHMYANGRGVAPSNSTALKWFRAAAEHNHAGALYGLGYMHLTGHGVAVDHKKAYKHFSSAAELGNTEAWFHLGVMHLNGWGTPRNAVQAQYFFSMTAKTGHALGMYNLAMMHLAKDAASCPIALELLKKVAEKGPWAAVLQEGREAFLEGDYDGALLAYLRAAEMGLELGQSNAAWLLTNGYSAAAGSAGPLAVGLHQRAAEQGHMPALLAVGDAFWFGRGTAPDWQRAGEVYAKATMGQAFFNLGYMHQYGAGLPQDLHLAKRYYDKALTAAPDAWLPVQLALAGLSAHVAWQRAAPRLPRWAARLEHLVFAAPTPPDAQQEARTPSMLDLKAAGWALGAAAGWAGRASGVSAALQASGSRLSGALSSGDGGETLVLLALLLVLVMVLRRRAALRTLYGPPPGRVEVPLPAERPPGARRSVSGGRRSGSGAIPGDVSGRPGLPGGAPSAGAPTAPAQAATPADPLSAAAAAAAAELAAPPSVRPTEEQRQEAAATGDLERRRGDSSEAGPSNG